MPIDYSLLLGQPTRTEGPSFQEMAGQAQQQRMQQLQYQQAQYQQQRQQRLADLARQTAGNYQDPTAQSYAGAGFGDEAQAAQHAALQRQKDTQAVMQFHRTLTAGRIRQAIDAGSQEQFDRIAATAPEEYGLKQGDPNWQKTGDAFAKSLLSEEQRAENNKTRFKTDEFGRMFDSFTGQFIGDGTPMSKNRYEMKFNPVTGAAYREDKFTGQFIPVTGGGGAPSTPGGEPSAPRDLPVTPGSKPANYKREVMKAFADDLDPTKGRNNLPAKAQAQIGQAERFEALLNAPGPFTMQRMHEATMIAATIANNGNVPTEAMVDHMLPKTLQGKSSEYWQSIADVPVDAGMAPFVEQLKNQSERETVTAKKQLQEYLLGRLSGHVDAFKNWPQEASRIAEARGLKGLYDPKTLLPLKGTSVHSPEEIAAAREWLADEKNAKHPKRAEVEALVKGAGGG